VSSLPKPLVVAFYLAKNNLNPLLRRRPGQAALYLLALTLLAMILLPLAVKAAAPQPPSWVYGLGLSREGLVKSTSALLTVTFLLTLIRGRREVAASEEAEHELLLALPLRMGEYVIGKTVYFAIQTLFYSAPVLYIGIPLVYSLAGFSSARAVLLVLAVVALSVYAETLVMLATIARVLSGERPIADVIGYAYLAASLVHSLLVRDVSPLLVAPSLPAVRPLVDVFSRKVAVSQLLEEFAILALVLASLLVALYLLSEHVHPENVRPLAEILREIGLARRKPVSLAGLSPREAVYRVTLGLTFLTKRHAIFVTVGLSLAVLLALVLKKLGMEVDPLTLSAFAVVFIASETTITSAFTAQRDLSHLWLYRTAPWSLKPLSSALLAKTLLYSLEGFTLVGLFRAVYSWNAAWLLLPIASLPFLCFTAILMLGFMVSVSARRRLVRYSSRGFYMVEDLVATALMGFSTVLAVVALTLFELMLEYASTLAWPLYLAAVSTAVALLLFKVGEDTLYRRMWVSDVS